MRKPLLAEITRVLIEWAAGRMMESNTINKLLGAYADYQVEALTGFSVDDWRACHVKATKIAS